MQRERVSENVYWFQSDIYAQVTAGVVAGPKWAVVIDTLALPEETLAMRSFIEEELNVPVRYIINTHHHADHTWGNCFFPGATIIAHTLCRQAMKERGMPALEEARRSNSALKQVKLILPHITLEHGKMSISVGKKTLTIILTPGNSMDGISVMIEEDRVLFAGDAFMPVPYIVDGDIDQLITTIQSLNDLSLENIIQGHGDIVLRGEIEKTIAENVEYLQSIKNIAKDAFQTQAPQEFIQKYDIESCGKSPILLGGLADNLHKQNLKVLIKQFQTQ
jgi:glyoxylase-like metal-dependent hydrolase (beta-lactamase superfamily II)